MNNLSSSTAPSNAFWGFPDHLIPVLPWLAWLHCSSPAALLSVQNSMMDYDPPTNVEVIVRHSSLADEYMSNLDPDF